MPGNRKTGTEGKRDPKRETDGKTLGKRETQVRRDRDGEGIKRKVDKNGRGAKLRGMKEVRERGRPCLLPHLHPSL